MREEELVVLRIMAALMIVVLLVDLALLAAYLMRQRQTEQRGAPPLFAPRWSLMDVWIGGHALVAGLIPVAIGAVVVVIIMHGPKFMSSPGGMNQLSGGALITFLAIAMTGQTILMVGIPVFFITRKYRTSLSQIGFQWPPRGRQLWTGFGLGLGMMAVSFVLQNSLMFALKATVGPAATEQLKEVTSKLIAERLLKDNASPEMFITLLIVAGIFAPFSEELFFRGFLYNAAKYRLGITAGVILSALIFALVHVGPLAVIGIIPMGILLALAYEKTGSLWVPIMMHATNNILAVTLTYLMPELGI